MFYEDEEDVLSSEPAPEPAPERQPASLRRQRLRAEPKPEHEPVAATIIALAELELYTR